MPRSAYPPLQKLIPIEILFSSLSRYRYLVVHSRHYYRPYIISSRR